MTIWQQAGHVVIVTGAGSGIGRATALKFAGAGASVLVADRDESGADAAADEIKAQGGVAVSCRVDVSRFEDVESMVAVAERELGPVDILVSNAGIGVAASVVETSLEDLDRVLAVNVKGVFYGAKAVIPGMAARGGGIIINTASAAALKAVRQRAAYIASKGAVIALTKAISLDHMNQGIRCNCVAPGTVDSPWIGSILADSDDPAGARERMVARQPIGRMARPDEIADAVMYLASDEAAFVHGSCLVIDGGFSIQ